jgi:hypothetical protein
MPRSSGQADTEANSQLRIYDRVFWHPQVRAGTPVEALCKELEYQLSRLWGRCPRQQASALTRSAESIDPDPADGGSSSATGSRA